MKKQFFPILLILLSFALPAQSQTGNQAIDSAIVNLYLQLHVYPQEKVYVQTDRPYYLTGEKIHFRAFLLHASTLNPSTFSRYVYVELVSPEDAVVARTMIRKDEKQLFYGTIQIPEQLPEGEYQLRSYTRYMENTGEDSFYTRSVYIANQKSAETEIETEFDYSRQGEVGVSLLFKDRKSGTVNVPIEVEYQTAESRKKEKAVTNADGQVHIKYKLKDANPSRTLLVTNKEVSGNFKKYIRIPYKESFPEISFYPEGGQIIANAKNRIAFKALLPDARGVDVKGWIYNSKDELQAEFASLHEGMGSFYLNVRDSETYYALCQYNGLSKEIPLPNIQTGGISLQAVWESDSLLVTALTSLSKEHKKHYLLIHRQGVPVYFQVWDWSRNGLKISKNLFKTGVSHLLLLSENFQPVSERKVFINLQHEPEIQVGFNKTKYLPRERVSLTVDLPQATNDTLPLSLALSVTDDRDVKLDTTTNIVAEILLSSELKGYIHHPTWYFGNDEKVAEAADLLMLTHGWRRYFVSRALQGKLEKPGIKPEISQRFTGTLKKPNQQPYKNEAVKLTAIGCNFSEVVESDEQGRFEFDNFEFPDSTAYQFLSYTKKRTEDIEVWVDDTAYPPISNSMPWYGVNATKENENNEFLDYVGKANRKYIIENGMRQIDLDEFTVKAKKKVERIDSNLSLPEPDIFISPEELYEYPPASFDDLFYRIPGVQDVTEYGVHIKGDNAVIVLDGIARSLETLRTMYDVSIIGQVDIYNSIAVAKRWRGGRIAIVLTSWTHSTLSKFNNRKPENIKNILPLGYQLYTEFYSPKYDTADAFNNPTEDLRSTIYWKPNILLEKNHKTNLDFYTADTPGSYSIVIEGVGQGRKLIYYRKNAAIQVVKKQVE